MLAEAQNHPAIPRHLVALGAILALVLTAQTCPHCRLLPRHLSSQLRRSIQPIRPVPSPNQALGLPLQHLVSAILMTASWKQRTNCRVNPWSRRTPHQSSPPKPLNAPVRSRVGSPSASWDQMALPSLPAAQRPLLTYSMSRSPHHLQILAEQAHLFLCHLPQLPSAHLRNPLLPPSPHLNHPRHSPLPRPHQQPPVSASPPLPRHHPSSRHQACPVL